MSSAAQEHSGWWFTDWFSWITPCLVESSEDINYSKKLSFRDRLTSSSSSSMLTLWLGEGQTLGVRLHDSLPYNGYSVCVESIEPESTAEQWGVHEGAYVIAVNDKSTRTLSISQVQNLFQRTKKPYSVRFMQPIMIKEPLDRNPYAFTEFPRPQGTRLPGLRPYVETSGSDTPGTTDKEDEEATNEPPYSNLHLPRRHYWMSDSSAKSCYECERPFTLLRRRHHCRSCGQIFCANCCSRLPQSFNPKEATLDRQTIASLRKQLVCHTCLQQLKDGLEVSVAKSPERRPSASQSSDVIPHSSASGACAAPKSLVIMPIHLVQEADTEAKSLSKVNNRRLRTMGPAFSFDNADPTNRLEATEIAKDDDDEEKYQVGEHDNSSLFSIFPRVQIVTSVQHPRHPPRWDTIIGACSESGHLIDADRKSNVDSNSSGQLRRSASDPALYCSKLHVTKRLAASLKRCNSRSSLSTVISEHIISLNEPLQGYSIDEEKHVSRALPNAIQTGNLKCVNPKLEIGLEDESQSVQNIPELLAEEERLGKIMRGHATDRLNDLVKNEMQDSVVLASIPHVVQKEWQDIIVSFSKRAAANITCDTAAGDAMDILNYVKVARFPGGLISQCKYVDGVLYRKSLSRKSMRRVIEIPRILLIATSLQYQRQPDHILSLENVAGQELEYMHIIVGKIMSLNPDVLIVGGHIHRIAEELLHKRGVVVVKNARREVLHEISRSTGAVLLASSDHVDKMAPDRVLGTCRRLRVVLHREGPRTKQRQFLCFEGANPSKYATFCLRGGTKSILDEVWRIFTVIIRAAYNMRLQRSCLTQLFLVPPDSLRSSDTQSNWFSPYSTSLYLALKSNSLSFRAASRERQQMCRYCKTVAADSAFGNATSSVERHRKSDAMLRATIHEPPKSEPIDKCTCRVRRGGVELREKILVSTCWSKLNRKSASKAEMMCIEFYQVGDCTLGQFLDCHCFDLQNKEFQAAFASRKLTFTHDIGRIVVRVIAVQDGAPHGGSGLAAVVQRPVSRILSQNQSIYMWTGGKSEKGSNHFSEMNRDTRNYSFGKFLEDMFYANGLSPSAIASPQLKDCSTSSIVRFFSKNGLVVCFSYERIEPVLHIAVQPMLWPQRADFRQHEADVRELEAMAIEVYESTHSKLQKSMGDIVTTSHTKKKLDLMKNEVQHWLDRFRYNLRSDPPTEIFVKNDLIRQMYLTATGWSTRISESMQATVKYNPHESSSPKGALPRSWFGGTEPPADEPMSPPIAAAAGALEKNPAMSGNVGMDQLAMFAKQVASGQYVPSPVASPLTDAFLSPPPTNAMESEVGSTTVNSLYSGEDQRTPMEELNDIAEGVGSGSARTLGYFAIPSRLLQWHPNLPIGVDNTVVLVNRNQPTSVVAYSLCSWEYTNALNDHFTAEGIPLSHRLNAVEVQSDINSDAAMLRALRSYHRSDVQHSFVDETHFQPITKFRCRSYFAMQFQAIRRLYYGTDRKYVESLCHCEQWLAAGGKSGAGFMKTQDQRFIAKVIPTIELQMFLDIAEEYFKYMAKTFENQLTSMLSKILGVYEVMITGERYATDRSMCLIIMENLVYGREIDILFDLKGKMEGRFKQDDSSGVLWDRNFVEMAGGMPVPVQESAMSLLLSASINDTKFLSSIEITDYSMLVGYDHRKQEVVACIIDYIHKYDFLKMMEHAGKRLIQEQGEITVLNPRQYRKRFRTAILKYFTTIPCRYTNVTAINEFENGGSIN